MSNDPVQSLIGDTPLEYLSEIDLKGANRESHCADKEEDRAQDTDSLEKKGRRQDHVGQEETGEPPSGWILSQPVEHRVEDRVKKEGKRADHDHDFKGHDEKDDYASPCCDIPELFKVGPVLHEFSFPKMLLCVYLPLAFHPGSLSALPRITFLLFFYGISLLGSLPLGEYSSKEARDRLCFHFCPGSGERVELVARL